MKPMTAVIIGVVSSLIATFIFYCIIELFKRVILPWFTDKIYRGVRIDGKWTSTVMKDPELGISSSMQLNQKGEAVTGTYSHSINKNGNIDTTDYYLNGIIRDTYFTVTLKPVAKDMIDSIAFILRVHTKISGALAMKGTCIFIDPTSGKTSSHENEFVKEIS